MTSTPMTSPSETPAETAALRAVLLIDLVESTRLVDELGDARAAEIGALHDRLARDLLAHHDGREIDKSDGFLLLFERPLDAVAYCLAYHRELSALSARERIELRARAGIHFGEVFLRENTPEDIARGAKPLEVEGLAKVLAARATSLAAGRQTLLTRAAFDLARQAAEGERSSSGDWRWLAHGRYAFKGVAESLEVFEVGEMGFAPLEAPPDSAKAERIVEGGEEILGWRPAAFGTIPQRPNWSLQERLGEGGFGEVWRAEHSATGENRVFKFCYEPERLRALQREVTLFRLLKEVLGDRDDIARILDWNFEAAPYFLEAEYTEGGNLTEWLAEHGGAEGVPLATRLELVAEVADALAAAHSVGVLHKDVKPANVLVYTGGDGQPRARLTDFGIGLVMDRELLLARGITVLGATEMLPGGQASSAGTQLYMAPELLEGKPVTVQADIYALGVLLYQVVVGDSARALAPGWKRDVDDDLLAADIAEFVDGRPERRPASAALVAERLRSLERRRSAIEAERQRREEAARARRELVRAQRRRRLSMTIAAISLVVVAVVSVLAWRAVEASREAESRRDQAEDLIGFMLGDLRQKLEPIGKLPILEDVGTKAMEYFAAVPEEKLSDEELFRRSHALRQIGEVRLGLEKIETAEEAFEEALALGRGLAARDPSNGEWQLGLAHSEYWVGYVYWLQGDLDAALGPMERYLEVAEALVARDPENRTWQLERAYAETNLGRILEARGDLEGSLEHYRKTLEIERELLAEEPDDVELRFSLAFAHNSVGLVLEKMGRLEETLEHYRADLEIKRSLVEDDPSNMAWREYLTFSHNYLGNVLEVMGELEPAREHFREAVELSEQLVEHDPANNAWRRHLGIHLSRMGKIHLAQGSAAAALEHFDRFAETMAELVARDPENSNWRRDLGLSHRYRAEVLLTQGRPEEALSEIQRSLGLLEGDDTDRQTLRRRGESEVTRGEVLEGLGRFEEARAAWQRAAKILEEIAAASNNKHFLVPWAEALLHLDRLEDARPVIEKLEDLGYRHPDFLRLCASRGLSV